MIHPTAITHSSAKLGANVSVGPFAIIEEGVDIGENCKIAAHAIVRKGSILGSNVWLDSFAVVGGEPQDYKFDPATASGVRIGDGAILREGATVHRATKPGAFTEVGADCMLMVNSHVGHDCKLGAKVIMANCALLAGHIEVGEGSFLSGGTVFHQFIRIGEGVMVSGNARIGLDIPPFTLATERNELHGFNIVGLRRRGCDAATIAELKLLYKTIYQGGAPRKNAAAAGELAKTDAGKKFLAFFAAGKRGFLTPTRNGNAESTE